MADLSIPESVREILIRSGLDDLYPPQEDAIKPVSLEGRTFVLAY